MEKTLLKAKAGGDDEKAKRIAAALDAQKIKEITLLKRHWKEETEMRKKIEETGLEEFLKGCREISTSGWL
jgi:hypothetical protein